jgi:cohesin loading factor subunit SCC2
MHQHLHQKFETIIEKEYMLAIEIAYEYQRAIKDIRGATRNPYIAKLHFMMDVMKGGKVKSRKKFYENLCARLDIDLSKDWTLDIWYYLHRSQFIIDNMAFFENVSVEEFNMAIMAMEGLFARSGMALAHAIDTEVMHINDLLPSVQKGGCSAARPVNPARLQLLTAFSMTLLRVWEARTYLRRQYGLLATDSEAGNKATKDFKKAPVRDVDVSGDTFWNQNCMVMTNMKSKENMLNHCKVFVNSFNAVIDAETVSSKDTRPNTTLERSLSRRKRKRGADAAPYRRSKKIKSAAEQT